MDIENIPRRERRHYRRYKDGEIIYSDSPKRTSFDKKEDYKESYKSYKEDDTDTINLLKLDKEEKEVVDNSQKIKKVLNNLSEIISPDIDAITDVIYTQIKNDASFNDFKKEKIQETIKRSKHYRATEENEAVDKDDVKDLVRDVFIQLEKENKKEIVKDREKISKDVEKKNEEKKVEEKKKEDKNIKKVKEEKKTVTKKEEKKKDVSNLFKEENDFEKEDLEEDDLGLKF